MEQDNLSMGDDTRTERRTRHADDRVPNDQPEGQSSRHDDINGREREDQNNRSRLHDLQSGCGESVERHPRQETHEEVIREEEKPPQLRQRPFEGSVESASPHRKECWPRGGLDEQEDRAHRTRDAGRLDGRCGSGRTSCREDRGSADIRAPASAQQARGLPRPGSTRSRRDLSSDGDRERDRDTDIGKDRESDRDRDRNRDKDRDKDRERDRGREIDMQRGKDRGSDRVRDRDKDKNRDGDRERGTGRETDRDRDTERGKERDRDKDGDTRGSHRDRDYSKSHEGVDRTKAYERRDHSRPDRDRLESRSHGSRPHDARQQSRLHEHRDASRPREGRDDGRPHEDRDPYRSHEHRYQRRPRHDDNELGRDRGAEKERCRSQDRGAERDSRRSQDRGAERERQHRSNQRESGNAGRLERAYDRSGDRDAERNLHRSEHRAPEREQHTSEHRGVERERSTSEHRDAGRSERYRRDDRAAERDHSGLERRESGTAYYRSDYRDAGKHHRRSEGKAAAREYQKAAPMDRGNEGGADAARLGAREQRATSRERHRRASSLEAPRRGRLDQESKAAKAYDLQLDFFSTEFDALKALYSFGLQPPNPKVLPLDNISKCRAILPAELPDSRAARMAAKPKVRLSEEERREKLERSRARTSTLRSRREASDPEQPPALQRVADLVPQGPLNTLRACLGSRQLRLRVVTRHRKGVRGVATGYLLGFDRYMNLIMSDVEEQYTVRLRAEKTKVVGVAAQRSEAKDDSDDEDGSPEQGKEKRGKLERSRLVWKQDARVRRLRQVLLRGSSVVIVSHVPVAPVEG